MDIVQLKEIIIENIDNYIPTILEHIGCKNISNYAKEFRCNDGIHTSSNGIRVSKYSLHTKSYYDNWEGDVITLVQKLKNCNFKDAIYHICKWLDIDTKIEPKPVILPFSGYFKDIKIKKETDINIPIYNKNLLNNYYNISNKRFLKDNISLKSQLKYGIMYDIETNRITIPWYNSEGDLVGVIGRFNASKKYITENNIAKYFPLISFPKSQLLYALNMNYNSIIKEKTIFVGEAEKFSMQLDTYGVELGVSLGSHSISDTQIKLIHSMFPNQIIVCFDEGVEEEEILSTCKKLKYKTDFCQCKIGYIFDKNNLYLEKESKSSPTDLGKEIFVKLLKECLIWI